MARAVTIPHAVRGDVAEEIEELDLVRHRDQQNTASARSCAGHGEVFEDGLHGDASAALQQYEIVRSEMRRDETGQGPSVGCSAPTRHRDVRLEAASPLHARSGPSRSTRSRPG